MCRQCKAVVAAAVVNHKLTHLLPVCSFFRWKRIDMVRRLCTAAAADGIDNELTRRFVRNLKSTQEESLLQFKLASSDIWEKQVRVRDRC